MPDSEGLALLRDLNSFHLDPELLRSAMRSYAEADPETREDYEEYIQLIVMAVHAHGLTGDAAVTASMAIQFRLSALSRLLKEGGGRGFRLSTAEPGREFLDVALVRCVAEEPFVLEEGPVQYDAVSFHRRLLSIASPAGRA